MDNVQYSIRYYGIYLLLCAVLAQGPDEPVFGKSYNFTCTLSHYKRVLLKFTAAATGVQTTLYTARKQHPQFWNLLEYTNQTADDEIHHIFTIRNVTTDRLGTYHCYDNNGSLMYTKDVLSARDEDRFTPTRGNEGYGVTTETITNTSPQDPSVVPIVIATSLAIIVAVVISIVIAIWIKKRKRKTNVDERPHLTLLSRNESTRTTPTDQHETTKSPKDSGDATSTNVQIVPLKPGVSDAKESRTDDENRQHEKQALEDSNKGKNHLGILTFDISSKLTVDVGYM